MRERKRNLQAASTIADAIVACKASLTRYVATFFVTQEDIEDTIHEAYLQALAAERKVSISSPRAYLFRVAKNIALNKKARQKKIFFENIGEFQDLIVDDETPNADEQLYWRGLTEKLGQAISELPPQCQKVFILQRLQGLSYKEVAQKLGISVRTVEKHLEKGLMRCAAHLAEGGLDDWKDEKVATLDKYRNQ